VSLLRLTIPQKSNSGFGEHAPQTDWICGSSSSFIPEIVRHSSYTDSICVIAVMLFNSHCQHATDTVWGAQRRVKGRTCDARIIIA
jgi:hypothetical protein